MKFRVAPVSLVMLIMFASGCGEQPKMTIDHSSARQLAISVHEASAARDYAAMADAMSPEFRGAYRDMLMAAHDYVASLDALASEVERKIGAVQAERFRRQAQNVYAGMMCDPFEAAVRDGQIQWDYVSIFEEGQVTSVAVVGAKSEFDRQYALVRVKDQWYFEPRQGASHGVATVSLAQRKTSYEREAKLVQTTFEKYTKLTQDLRRDVRTGAINAGNFAEKMSSR